MRKFSDRHIGVPDLDEKSMKDYLGVESLDQFNFSYYILTSFDNSQTSCSWNF